MNPFSMLGAKIFLGTTALFLVIAGVQTGRIEWYYKPTIKTIRIDLEKARARTEAEIATHQATKRAYREAQAEAARQEAERIARVIASQQEITDEVSADYRKRLADARARAERLRSQLTGTGAAGEAGSVPVSEAGGAPGGSDAAPSEDRLSDEERLIATEQAIQLDELITWVQRQMGVR